MGRRLESAWPGIRLEYVTISTGGDREAERPLPEIGLKGLFTAELERALGQGTVDVAVHSAKDLPTELDPALTMLAVTEREDPRDALVTGRAVREARRVEDLPSGTVVGTSSLRRRAQLLRWHPECVPRPIRGNVETRLAKLERGEYDALILASAGLARLGLLDERVCPLEPTEWLPAPGQGALAVEGRSSDGPVREAARAVEDEETRSAVTAERAFLAALEGGCQVPIGALARPIGSELELRGQLLSLDGRRVASGVRRGPRSEPGRLGRLLAAELLERGGREILEELRESGV